MKNKKSLLWLVWLVPFLPFIFGCIVFGSYYIQAGENAFSVLTDTVYDTIRLYSLAFTRSGNEITALLGGVTSPAQRVLFLFLINFARFGSMVVIGVAVFQLFRSYLMRIYTWAKGTSTDNYALYGDAPSTAALKKQLGSHALPLNNPELYHARNHIVAFHDYDRALSFLSENLTKMQGDPRNKVYIYTTGDIQSERLNPHLIINNSARNCARLYWDKYYLKADERSVVIIGFGRYGEELLTHALENNVYLDDRAIQYHVFGDGRKYLAQHSQLSQFLSLSGPDAKKDSLTFHSEHWYEQMGRINAASRVILCADSDAENLRLMNEMRGANMRAGKGLDLRLSSPDLLQTLWQFSDEKLRVFGTDEELYTVSQATNNELYARGRLVHAYYYGMQHGRDPMECLKDEAFQHEWETTSHYNRTSSIAQNDHSDVKVRELLGDDSLLLTEETAHAAAAHYQELSEEERIPCLLMEHHRWCRFLWMNGWSYAPERDNVLRHHPLLVPFEQLSREEILKDENAFVILKDAGTELK